MITPAQRHNMLDGMYHLEHSAHAYESSLVPSSYIKRVLKKISLPPNSLVLDLGSGVGHEAKAISDLYNSRVIEADISSDAFAANPKEARMFTIVDANKSDLPFASGSADLVHSKDNLIHIEDKQNYFEEVHRVLKPGGRFLLTTQCAAEGKPACNFFSIVTGGHRDDK